MHCCTLLTAYGKIKVIIAAWMTPSDIILQFLSWNIEHFFISFLYCCEKAAQYYKHAVEAVLYLFVKKLVLISGKAESTSAITYEGISLWYVHKSVRVERNCSSAFVVVLHTQFCK